MNIADLVMVVFVAAMILFGIKKGFIKMIIDFMSSIVAFFAAAFFSRSIAGAIQDFAIFNGMKKGIQEFFTNNADLASKNVTQAIDGIAIPQIIKNYILKDFPDPAQTLNSGAQALADRVFYLMLLAIVCIALFILIRVAFYFVEATIEKIFEKIKILDVINKFLGAFVGLANAILIIYVVLAIVVLLSSRIPEITSTISESAVLSKLYFNNLLIMILT